MGQPGLQSQRTSGNSTKTKMMAKATRQIETQGPRRGEVRCIGIQS